MLVRNPLFLIAGPCVIECESHARMMAERVSRQLPQTLAFRTFSKLRSTRRTASSVNAFRGPGLKEGLRILGKIKSDLKLSILTDIHEASQAAPAAEVADILQIPAFLARQTDLLVAAGKTGRVINVKKPQFLSPSDMKNVVEKIASTGNTTDHFDGTRFVVWLPESGGRFSRDSANEKIWLSGGVRRDAFGAIAGRTGSRQRRAAGIHRAAGACGGGRRRGWTFS